MRSFLPEVEAPAAQDTASLGPSWLKTNSLPALRVAANLCASWSRKAAKDHNIPGRGVWRRRNSKLICLPALQKSQCELALL